MSRPRSLKAIASNLPFKELMDVRTAVLRPVAQLANNVGKLKAPFEYLRDVEFCFDPTPKLLMHYADKGDQLAIRAFKEFSADEEHMLLGKTDNSETSNLAAFEAAHKSEAQQIALKRLNSFGRNSFGDSNFDKNFLNAVQSYMGPHGFQPVNRGFDAIL